MVAGSWIESPKVTMNCNDEVDLNEYLQLFPQKMFCAQRHSAGRETSLFPLRAVDAFKFNLQTGKIAGMRS